MLEVATISWSRRPRPGLSTQYPGKSRRRLTQESVGDADHAVARFEIIISRIIYSRATRRTKTIGLNALPCLRTTWSIKPRIKIFACLAPTLSFLVILPYFLCLVTDYSNITKSMSMDSLATTLLFAVMLLGQVRLFCGVILRKCVNIHTTLSDIVILPPWVILLTYIILRVRVFSSTEIDGYISSKTAWAGFHTLAAWRCGKIFKIMSLKLIIQMSSLLAGALNMKWLSGECHRTSQIKSQHWFR